MVSRSLALFGVVNELKRIKDNNTTFSFRITANGPLNSGLRDRCVVYVEISKREMVLCKTIPVKFDRPEYQLPIKNLSGMALEEVGAEKVRAIMTRDKARDIYDLYYLIHNKKIKIDNKLTVQKLKYYKTGFSKLKLIEKINDSNDYYKKELTTIVLEDIPDYKFVRTTIDDWIL